MSTIRAPYPSKMDTIHNQSVISLDRPGTGEVANFSNRSKVVASFIIRNNPATMIKAIRRIGSGEVEGKDVILRDWYRPFSTAMLLPALPVLQASGSGNRVSWSPDGL